MAEPNCLSTGPGHLSARALQVFLVMHAIERPCVWVQHKGNESAWYSLPHWSVFLTFRIFSFLVSNNRINKNGAEYFTALILAGSQMLPFRFLSYFPSVGTTDTNSVDNSYVSSLRLKAGNLTLIVLVYMVLERKKNQTTQKAESQEGDRGLIYKQLHCSA